MLILTTKNIIYKHDMQPIPGNTILEVENNHDSSYRITRGVYERIAINKADCIPYEQPAINLSNVHQELLQRREEVKKMMRRVEQAESDKKLAVAAVVRLQEEVGKLKRENQRLMDEVDTVREAKKVKLPQDVAKAIDMALYKNGNKDFLAWKITREPSPLDKYYFKILFKHGNERSFLDVINAIQYGYIIEEPQTFTTNRKLDSSEICTLRNWYKGALLRIKDGKDRDEYCKEAIEEVSLYLGGAELLKDISPFCSNQLKRENADRSG